MKKTSELDQLELEEMWKIYSSIYIPKKLGLSEDDWRENLLKKYHFGLNKRAFLFGEKEIVSYVLLTESFVLEDRVWSKRLESASKNLSDLTRSEIFVKANKQLLLDFEGFCFGEVSVLEEKVINLLEKCGYVKMKDVKLAESLLDKTVGEGKYVLDEMSGDLIVVRSTAVSQNKLAYIMSNFR